MKPTLKVALAIVLNGRNVLICQRLAQSHLGGLWEFPGGKIEQNERPEQCALRELTEETGVEARIIEAWPIQEFEYPTRRVRLHPFICQFVRGESRPLACLNPTWVDIRQLRDHTFPPANDAMLSRLQSL